MLKKIINSKTRLAILSLLFQDKDKEYYGREIINKLKFDQASVHKELLNLINSGLVMTKNKNNKKYYLLNKASNYYDGFCIIFEEYNIKNEGEKWFSLLEMPNYYPMMAVTAANIESSKKAFDFMGLKNIMTKILTKYENNYTDVLLIKNEFKEASSSILNSFLKNPKLFEKYYKLLKEKVKVLIIETDKLEKTNLANLSNKELYELYNKYYSFYEDLHWLHWIQTCIDFDDNVLSVYLMKYLKEKIKNNKKYSIGDVFAVLTTPTEESNTTKEYKNLLKILKYIQCKKKLNQYFKNTETRIIVDGLMNKNKNLSKLLDDHIKNFGWLGYNTSGPVWGKDYYIDILGSLVRQKSNSDKLLIKFLNNTKNIKENKKKMIKELDINKKYQNLFDIARKIVFTKGLRKDSVFYSYFVMENFFKEIGRRFYISIKQARYLYPHEYKDLLLKNRLDATKLNNRYKYSVHYSTGHYSSDKLVEGEEAKKIYDSVDIIKENIENIKILFGDCASAGRVRGKVTIINIPEDMKKMEQGDILVSIATTPDLTLAIKKSSAIITDLGGITCHAAIVSREFGISCIIGTKIATKVLKDGDIVDVDATHGKVVIIERAE